ncbi:MAG: MBL fold metallo-hydrolase [Clostridia bacterium]|nr:MBL fold metallo-hydrolase [Clostridia bacterium]
MGYRAEKEKTERKRKILKRILLGVLLLCIVGLAIFSAIVPPVTWKYYVNLPKISRRGEGELRIHFIDVGQGDSTLIELPDGKIMLIDGGNSAKPTKKKVLRYLNALKIDTIDYLVVTHADVDHCGSLNEVVKYKGVRNAFLPFCEIEDGSEYARLYDTLMKSNCSWAYGSSKVQNLTSANEKYPYSAAFLYPHSDYVNEGLESGEFPSDNMDNYYSSVVYLEYMGIRTLFTGDIPKEIEAEIKKTDESGLYANIGASLRGLDVLKVSHHGSKDANSKEFLDYTAPKTAVISCGANNTCGNPSETVLARLNNVGAQVYRTDVHGNIMITIPSDGSPYTVTTV